MRLHLFTVFTATVALAACGGEPTGTDGADDTSRRVPSSASIDIRDFQFTPTTVTVQAGGSVLWTNIGPSEHTASSNEELWDSGVITALTDGDEDDDGGGGYGYSMAAGEGTYERRFNDAGTYEYHCSIHADMHGTIVVSAQ